jgi:hypothetical protein
LKINSALVARLLLHGVRLLVQFDGVEVEPFLECVIRLFGELSLRERCGGHEDVLNVKAEPGTSLWSSVENG